MSNPTQNYEQDSAQLVINLLDDSYRTTDDAISKKAEAFEAEESVQDEIPAASISLGRLKRLLKHIGTLLAGGHTVLLQN